MTVLISAGGCGDEDPVALEATRLEMTPHPVFLKLWLATQVCSERTGDLAGIRWFVTTAFETASTLGQWNSRREITIRIDKWNDFGVIRHEMLHDLLRGDGEHFDPAWNACDVPKGNAHIRDDFFRR